MDIIFFYWILEIDLLSITSPYSGTLQTNELFPWICEACLPYLHFPQSLLIACFIVGLYVHKNMLDPVQAPFRWGGGWLFPSCGCPWTRMLCWVNRLTIFSFSDYQMRMILLTKTLLVKLLQAFSWIISLFIGDYCWQPSESPSWILFLHTMPYICSTDKGVAREIHRDIFFF